MKVGDYVRTKYGITQYKEYDTQYGEKILAMPIHDMTQGFFANVEDIIKSSPNIIDLIEVGDYVDGIYVDIIEKEQKRVWHTSSYGDEDVVFYNEDIKSIVTHEQFSQMEYKVKSQV